jgi:hypothetical protein
MRKQMKNSGSLSKVEMSALGARARNNRKMADWIYYSCIQRIRALTDYSDGLLEMGGGVGLRSGAPARMRCFSRRLILGLASTGTQVRWPMIRVSATMQAHAAT